MMPRVEKEKIMKTRHIIEIEISNGHSETDISITFNNGERKTILLSTMEKGISIVKNGKNYEMWKNGRMEHI